MFEPENPIVHKRLNSNKCKEGRFMVRNLRANFHVCFLLTVDFAIYSMKNFLPYLVNFSIKNVHDKITSKS